MERENYTAKQEMEQPERTKLGYIWKEKKCLVGKVFASTLAFLISRKSTNERTFRLKNKYDRRLLSIRIRALKIPQFVQRLTKRQRTSRPLDHHPHSTSPSRACFEELYKYIAQLGLLLLHVFPQESAVGWHIPYVKYNSAIWNEVWSIDY